MTTKPKILCVDDEPINLDLLEAMLVPHGYEVIKAAGGDTWSCYWGNLTQANVKEAQQLGLKVLAWTVNDARRMGQLMDMGVDGIVTDRPDLLRQEMQRHGLAVPAPAPVGP